VYAPDWGGYLHKIDASTGKAIWSIKLDDSFAAGTGAPEDTEPYVTIDGEKRPVRLVSQASPTVHGSLVIVSLKRPLTASGRVDAKVYYPANHPENPFGVTNPPAGAYIAAFNKNTRELKWKQVIHDFHFNHAGNYTGMSGSAATARPLVFGNRPADLRLG
jgi:outer membrane protein assembly factor BamB